MADLFPYEKYGTGFLGMQNAGEITRRNRLRQRANADAQVLGQEEALRKYGKEIFGPDYEAPDSARHLGEAIRSMKPSSTVVNPDPDFKGPLVQPPSYDLGIDTKPRADSEAPPSLAESVFAAPYHPDRPERGGFGQSSLISDESAMGGDPMVERDRATGEAVSGSYPRASHYDQSGLLAEGDPYAQPRDVIPQYLRRPETTEADPTRAPEPSPYAPGGARYEVPGMSFDDLLLEKPEQARAYMANRKALSETHEVVTESEGRKATQGYIRARRQGVSEKDAYDQYGETMEATEVGRKFLESVGARRETQAKGRKLEQEERQRQQAQAFIAQKVAELRRDTENPVAQQYADVLEAQAQDPKLADQMMKVLEQQTKAEEARIKRDEADKPTVIGDVPYNRVRDAEGRPTRAIEPTPGFQGRAKAWYEGKDLNELYTMSKDPTLPGPIRQQAADTYRQRIADQKSVQAAGQMKWTPGEIEEMQNTLMTAENYQRVANMIRENPTGWGGPGGFFAKFDKAAGAFGWSTESRMKARGDIEQSASMLRKAIFGTALSAHEAKFATWLPTGTEESVPELLAKLEATAENIKRAIQYKVYLKNGGDPTKLPLMATPQGDVDLQQPNRMPKNPRPSGTPRPLTPQEQNLIQQHQGGG